MYIPTQKTIHCPLPSDQPAKNQPAITSFSAGEFRCQLALSDNPDHQVFSG